MTQFDTSDASVTIETLSDTNVADITPSSHPDTTESLSLGSLLGEIDYFFYTWTILLGSLIVYISFYKYHEYEQKQKRKALLSRQHTLTRQQLLHQQQQLQLQQLKQPIVIKVFNVLLDVVYFLILRFYEFFKNKLSAHIFIDATTNAHNSQSGSSSSGGFNLNNDVSQTAASQFFSSAASSFRNTSAGDNLQDLFCLNNCFKWFYFSGETTRRINSTILSSLNNQVNSASKNPSVHFNFSL